MTGVLKAVGTIAGVVSVVASFIPGGQLVASIAAAVSVVASIGAALTAKKPTAKGSETQITIGSDLPSQEIRGRRYSGGSRIAMVAYGGEFNDVKNPFLWCVDDYSVGGPLHALVATYADFTQINFDGSGKAIGFYSNNTLYRDTQLGATPEGSALTPHFSGPPDWGSNYKLSGHAAIGWNARWPKDGKRYGSGFFQSGAVWEGVLYYDPREDDTYPGGEGSQRWASPYDKTAFSAAKATWVYGANPALHALRYLLGTWERDESDTDAEYRKVFGIGLDWDAIVVEDFVALANVADANGWECNVIIGEPADKWDNLKTILQAASAETCFRNGRVGLKYNAPRVALDTITRDDIVGEVVVPAMQSYRDRLNTIVPEYCSSSHKWEYVASSPVQVTEYVTEDGEEKREVRRYNAVTDADQAAQLAAYDLVGGREQGPIELPCKPRLRGYGPGDLLTVDLPELGVDGVDCVIVRRSIDPASMQVQLTLVSETASKHAFALAQTGTSPPAISIIDYEDMDGVASGAVPDAPTITEVNLIASQDSANDVNGIRLAVTVDGPTDDDPIYFIRWQVDGDASWNELQYSNQGAAPATLLTDFVPTNTTVNVQAAVKYGATQLSEWSGTTIVSTDILLGGGEPLDGGGEPLVAG